MQLGEREGDREGCQQHTVYGEGQLELDGDTYRLRHRVAQRDRYTVAERDVLSQLERREREVHRRDGYIVRQSGTRLVENDIMAEV